MEPVFFGENIIYFSSQHFFTYLSRVPIILEPIVNMCAHVCPVYVSKFGDFTDKNSLFTCDTCKNVMLLA